MSNQHAVNAPGVERGAHVVGRLLEGAHRSMEGGYASISKKGRQIVTIVAVE